MYARILICMLAGLWSHQALADELFVGEGEAHSTIGSALAVAARGDVVSIRAGQYAESLETTAPGVTLRGVPAGAEVVVTHAGRVLRISHPDTTVEGIVFDGQFGDRDAVQIRDEGNNTILRRVEVRNSGRDCIDMGRPSDILIEDSLVHHCLQSSAPECAEPGCREDAHGITGSPRANVTLRGTEIHTVSGDAIQFDPTRSDPGWTGLLVEDCRIWVGPLPAAIGGYAAGVVPGENALDTKTSDDTVDPADVTIRDTVVYGWRGGLISNMAAFNLKENVRVSVERVTVHDTEIAFRLRGRTAARPRGAQVKLVNTVVYDVDTAVRYEDGIEVVQMDHVTLGAEVGRIFDDQSEAGRIEARNTLVLGAELPPQLAEGSNLAVGGEAFVDAAVHDYHLALGSPAVDAGEALEDVVEDREGRIRPVGDGWDIGAYERPCEPPCEMAMDDGGVPPAMDGGILPSPDGMVSAPDGAMPTPDAGAPAEDAETSNADMRAPAEDTMAPAEDGGVPAEDAASTPSSGETDEGGCAANGRDQGSGAWWALLCIVLARRRRGARCQRP